MHKKLHFIILIVFLISFVIFFITGLSLIGQGFELKENYTYANQYVGGDAYNYIINGTYFSGYCSLGGSLLICSMISALFACQVFLTKIVPIKSTIKTENLNQKLNISAVEQVSEKNNTFNQQAQSTDANDNQAIN